MTLGQHSPKEPTDKAGPVVKAPIFAPPRAPHLSKYHAEEALQVALAVLLCDDVIQRLLQLGGHLVLGDTTLGQEGIQRAHELVAQKVAAKLQHLKSEQDTVHSKQP